MRKYEVTYILAPEVSEEEVPARVENYQNLVTEHKSEVVKVDNWGKRRLAYPIKGKEDGTYVVMRFNSEVSEGADELRRVMKNSDEVLRSLIVCVD